MDILLEGRFLSIFDLHLDIIKVLWKPITGGTSGLRITKIPNNP